LGPTPFPVGNGVGPAQAPFLKPTYALYLHHLVWLKRSLNGVADVNAGAFRPHFLNIETRLRHVCATFRKYDLGPTLQSIGRKTHGGYPGAIHAASCTNTTSTIFIAANSSVRRLSTVLYHRKQRRLWWAGPHLSYRRSRYAFISGRIASLSSGVWLRGADLHRDFRLYASCLSIWSHTRV